MDEQIVNDPVRLLEKTEREGKVSRPAKEAGIGVEQSEALQTLLPALSGSCALLAFLDTGRNKCVWLARPGGSIARADLRLASQASRGLHR